MKFTTQQLRLWMITTRIWQENTQKNHFRMQEYTLKSHENTGILPAFRHN